MEDKKLTTFPEIAKTGQITSVDVFKICHDKVCNLIFFFPVMEYWRYERFWKCQQKAV